jgi:hypothetical protein
MVRSFGQRPTHSQAHAEDRVAPTQGFGKHSHQSFEIWSYVLQGELEHQDSLHNKETLRRGDVQMTSTGTGAGFLRAQIRAPCLMRSLGISHSEFNVHPTKETHFLQVRTSRRSCRMSRTQPTDLVEAKRSWPKAILLRKRADRPY